jgi:hypothetical protein
MVGVEAYCASPGWVGTSIKTNTETAPSGARKSYPTDISRESPLEHLPTSRLEQLLQTTPGHRQNTQQPKAAKMEILIRSKTAKKQHL